MLLTTQTVRAVPSLVQHLVNMDMLADKLLDEYALHRNEKQIIDQTLTWLFLFKVNLRRRYSVILNLARLNKLK